MAAFSNSGGGGEGGGGAANPFGQFLNLGAGLGSGAPQAPPPAPPPPPPPPAPPQPPTPALTWPPFPTTTLSAVQQQQQLLPQLQSLPSINPNFPSAQQQQGGVAAQTDPDYYEGQSDDAAVPVRKRAPPGGNFKNFVVI